jgi:small-conductance mechanosensitive channel
MRDFIDTWLFDPTISKLLTVTVTLLVVWAVVRLAKRSLSRLVKDSEARYRTRKFIGFLGWVIAVLVIAAIYSSQLGALTVTLGVAGAGIAFALQEVIASVAGWFAISFSGFYKTGDRVQVGGIKGDVIDIGILRTTLMELGEWVKGDLYSGRVVRVANSFVFKEPVFNYSGDFPFLWDEITLPIKYGCDYRGARELLERVATEVVGAYARYATEAWQTMTRQFMIEDARIEPMVTLMANDNWMEFTLRYVVDYKRRRSTKDLLFTRILEEIDKTEGRVGIASTTIHLVQTPTLDVRVRDTTRNGG